MSSSEFDIVFRGDIVLGHQLADVKGRLQQLFKADSARIDALFTGRPIPLKRNLDEATARKYRDALLKAGALVEICASDKAAQETPRSEPVAVKPATTPTHLAAEPESTRWTLAPVGAELSPARANNTAAPQVNVPRLSLRPAGGNLVDTEEITAPFDAVVTAPDLDLAAVGENLLKAEETRELPVAELELEDWGIAAPGSDLLTEDERPIVVPVAVANSDFGLAPVGSDLGQLKPVEKPITPDISRLRLADPPN